MQPRGSPEGGRGADVGRHGHDESPPPAQGLRPRGHRQRGPAICGCNEIKHDGFRVIARKDGTQVKLYRVSRTRPGDFRRHSNLSPPPKFRCSRQSNTTLRRVFTTFTNSTLPHLGRSL
jgi:hypothetical protein